MDRRFDPPKSGVLSKIATRAAQDARLSANHNRKDRKMPYQASDGRDPAVGVENAYIATPNDLATYDVARQQIAAMRPESPGFDIRDPNRYVFVAAFDGTGNDATQTLDSRTNVHALYENYDRFIHGDGPDAPGFSRMHARYIEGPGTQESTRQNMPDQASGSSVQDRVFEMYKDLGDKARQWKQENPDAQISVITFGFSRGAVEAAEFASVVGKYGIQADLGYAVQRDDDARSNTQTWKEWARGQPGSVPAEKEFRELSGEIVAPGKAQIAAVLFDPVATGAAEQHDRMLPTNISSAIQFTALDEHRTTFPVNKTVTDAMVDANPDRFANIGLAGCHSDIGGGYASGKGLAQMSGNLAGEYLNDLVGHRIHRAVQPDPDSLVVHDSNSTFFQRVGYAKTGYWYADRTQDTPSLQGDVQVGPGIDNNITGKQRVALDSVHMHPGGTVDDGLRPTQGTLESRPQLRPDDHHTPKPNDSFIGLHDRDQIDPTKLFLESSRRVSTLMDRDTNPTTAGILHERANDPEARHSRLALDESAQGRLSAAVANSAKEMDMDRIGEVALSRDGRSLIVKEMHDTHADSVKIARVDIDTALRTPMNDSLHALDPALARSPDNPKPQSLYSQAHELLQQTDLGRQHPEQLVEASARVASQARHDGLTAISGIQIAQGDGGQPSLVASQNGVDGQKQTAPMAVAQMFPNAQVAQPQQEQDLHRGHHLS